MRNILNLIILYTLLIPSVVARGQDFVKSPEKHDVNILSGEHDLLSFDTITSGSQHYYKLYSKFPVWSELGNLGFPALPAKWTGISNINQPFFVKGFTPYLNDVYHLTHYYTNSPYALMNYNSGGREDVNGQLIKVVFTRPVAPGFRLTGLLDFVTSPGHYKNQTSSQSSLSANLSISKPRYKLIAGVDRMQAGLEENGGVKDMQSVAGFYTRPGDVAVNLSKAASRMKWTRIHGRQEYDIFSPPPKDSTEATDSISVKKPAKPKLVHIFNYQLVGRYYKDSQSALSTFYSNNYLNDNEAQDSASFKNFENRLGFIHEGLLGDSANWVLQAGLVHNLILWRSNAISGTIQQLGLYSLAQIVKGSWIIKGRLDLNLLGYGFGNYLIDVNTQYRPAGRNWNISMDMISESYKPDVFLQAFSGNHDQWFHSLVSQQEQVVKIRARNNSLRFGTSLSVHAISNWIYFNKQAVPEQSKKGTILASLEVNKDFTAGVFRSNNYLLLQYTPAKEIPLPVVVASTSTFIHHDIHFAKTNGYLQLEYGIDIRYCSAYQGYAYRPSTGAFYLQDVHKLGNYPYIDVFAVMRVKRTRFFVRYEHVNSDLTGGNYFPVLNYPVKKRFLKYGFYWHFND